MPSNPDSSANCATRVIVSYASTGSLTPTRSILQPWGTIRPYFNAIKRIFSISRTTRTGDTLLFYCMPGSPKKERFFSLISQEVALHHERSYPEGRKHECFLPSGYDLS